MSCRVKPQKKEALNIKNNARVYLSVIEFGINNIDNCKEPNNFAISTWTLTMKKNHYHIRRRCLFLLIWHIIIKQELCNGFRNIYNVWF